MANSQRQMAEHAAKTNVHRISKRAAVCRAHSRRALGWHESGESPAEAAGPPRLQLGLSPQPCLPDAAGIDSPVNVRATCIAALLLIPSGAVFIPPRQFLGEAASRHPIQRKARSKVAGNFVGNGLMDWWVRPATVITCWPAAGLPHVGVPASSMPSAMLEQEAQTLGLRERPPRNGIAPCASEPGRGAFYRGPILSSEFTDAVERVPTGFMRLAARQCRRPAKGLDSLSQAAITTRLPPTRATHPPITVASAATANGVRSTCFTRCPEVVKYKGSP